MNRQDSTYMQVQINKTSTPKKPMNKTQIEPQYRNSAGTHVAIEQ